MKNWSTAEGGIAPAVRQGRAPAGRVRFSRLASTMVCMVVTCAVLHMGWALTSALTWLIATVYISSGWRRAASSS